MTTTTQTLKALIKLSGLSQKDYAETHGIAYKQFNRYTTGRTEISIDRLQKLAFDDGFKINVEYSINNL
jgi:transcriptional regulator with XRE-family HTH domain